MQHNEPHICIPTSVAQRYAVPEEFPWSDYRDKPQVQKALLACKREGQRARCSCGLNLILRLIVREPRVRIIPATPPNLLHKPECPAGERRKYYRGIFTFEKAVSFEDLRANRLERVQLLLKREDEMECDLEINVSRGYHRPGTPTAKRTPRTLLLSGAEAAGLTLWDPQSPSKLTQPSDICPRIYEELRRIRCCITLLEERLFAPEVAKIRQAEMIIERICKLGSDAAPAIVFGRIASRAPSASRISTQDKAKYVQLQLEGMQGVPICVPEKTWMNAKQVYRSEPTKRDDCTHVAIALVREKEGRLFAEHFSWARFSNNGIPVESFHELEVARKAVAEGRRFYKPVVNCFLEGDHLYMPDFVFLDTGPHCTYYEVDGINTEKYRERKRELRKHIPSARLIIWYAWNDRLPMPAFPPASDGEQYLLRWVC